MTSRGHVVIVDAYAQARFFPETFRTAGYDCVRVQSTVEVPRIQRADLDHSAYVADLTHRGDLDETVRALKPFSPVAVVAGCEFGVNFADLLSERLGTATNGTALSPARRDKFQMNQRIAEAGLPAVRQLLVTDPDELVDWHKAIDGRIVLKPVDSGSGDGVTYCDTPEQAVAAYHRILGTENIFSYQTRHVVAQEYLTGTEYMVNSVSGDGRHHVCDIWRTERVAVNGTLDICNVAFLEPRTGGAHDAMVAYAERVLDVLGIRYGPTHLEVKMTTRGPVLIEVGARLCGGDFPRFVREAVGESQYEWTVDAYVRPERFRARHREHYTIDRHLASVALISPVSGTLRAIRHLDTIRAMETFRDDVYFVRPGERIRPTIDDTTYVGQIRLMHAEEALVCRDVRTIGYLDGVGMYDVDA